MNFRNGRQILYSNMKKSQTQQLLQVIREFKNIRISRQFLQSSNENYCPTYKKAKAEQTNRNLYKAAGMYCVAAKKRQKILSSIKDFASVVHQLGQTSKAVDFLEHFKPALEPHLPPVQLQKYLNLIKNFRNQEVKPTGKHNIKRILMDLKDIKINEIKGRIIDNLFTNTNRIQNYCQFQELDFATRSRFGRYLVVEFKSFSGAKKALESFNPEWFAIDRYWLGDDWTIIWEVGDGRKQFEVCKENNRLGFSISTLAMSNKNYLEQEKALRTYNEKKIEVIKENSIKWEEVDLIEIPF